MGCGCSGGTARQTVTTADVQAAMTGEYVVRMPDGTELYRGTEYLAALRARNANRSAGATLSNT